MNKIRHTVAEREAILAKAVEISLASPGITERQLFIRSQDAALPVSRRRTTHNMPRVAYEWLAKSVYRQLGVRAKAAVAQQTTTNATISSSTLKDDAIAFVSRVFDERKADAFDYELRRKVESLESLVQRMSLTIEAMVVEQSKQSSQVSDFHRLLTNLLGDLNAYKNAEPPAIAEQSATPPPPPPPSEPTQPKAKPKKIKIGVIGPLQEQFQQIRSRIGSAADLVFIDKEKNLSTGTLRSCDRVVISRHALHRHFFEAQSAVGRDRVVRLPTGGIDAIAREVKQLAEAAV